MQLAIDAALRSRGQTFVFRNDRVEYGNLLPGSEIRVHTKRFIRAVEKVEAGKSSRSKQTRAAYEAIGRLIDAQFYEPDIISIIDALPAVVARGRKKGSGKISDEILEQVLRAEQQFGSLLAAAMFVVRTGLYPGQSGTEESRARYLRDKASARRKRQKKTL